MNAILIHGTCDREEYFSDKFPSLSNSHWFPWIQKQLLIKGIITQTPEIEDAYDPDYKKWEKSLDGYEISKETILVGHSCGAGFLIRWLSESGITIKKFILVAPWLDPKRTKTTDFFDFDMDKTISKRIETHLFYSKDDDEDILQSAKLITDNIPAVKVHELNNLGHFTVNDMNTEKFPELLEVILQ